MAYARYAFGFIMFTFFFLIFIFFAVIEYAFILSCVLILVLFGHEDRIHIGQIFSSTYSLHIYRLADDYWKWADLPE